MPPTPEPLPRPSPVSSPLLPASWNRSASRLPEFAGTNAGSSTASAIAIAPTRWPVSAVRLRNRFGRGT